MMNVNLKKKKSHVNCLEQCPVYGKEADTKVKPGERSLLVLRHLHHLEGHPCSETLPSASNPGRPAEVAWMRVCSGSEGCSSSQVLEPKCWEGKGRTQRHAVGPGVRARPGTGSCFPSATLTPPADPLDSGTEV